LESTVACFNAASQFTPVEREETNHKP